MANLLRCYPESDHKTGEKWAYDDLCACWISTATITMVSSAAMGPNYFVHYNTHFGSLRAVAKLADLEAAFPGVDFTRGSLE